MTLHICCVHWCPDLWRNQWSVHGAKTTSDLMKIDVFSNELKFYYKEVDIGVASAKAQLQTSVSDKDRMTFRMEYLVFVSSTTARIVEHSPLRYEIVRSMASFYQVQYAVTVFWMRAEWMNLFRFCATRALSQQWLPTHQRCSCLEVGFVRIATAVLRLVRINRSTGWILPHHHWPESRFWGIILN